MKNTHLLLGTIVLTVVMVVVIAKLFSGGSTTQETLSEVPLSELVPEGAHTKGATESAKVVVTEFSDFQCPACRAAESVVDQLMDAHGDDVKFVYRHFPLDQIHPNARMAAQAAEAAAESDKFWEMHSLLFDRQSEWEGIRNKDELFKAFSGYAEQLQIDKNIFLERIESDEVKMKVQADSAYASQLGLNSTPTFFVNGQQVSAPQLMSSVEQLLSQASDEASESPNEASIEAEEAQ